MFVVSRGCLIKLSKIATKKMHAIRNCSNSAEVIEVISTFEHGLKGKPSNNRKDDIIRQLFKQFIEKNRTPNGRKKGKKYRLLPIFKSIKSYVTKRHSKVMISIHSAFNDVLQKLIAAGNIDFVLR